MKTLILFLALLSFGASAADSRVDTMVGNCTDVMVRDVCRVVLDRKNYPNPTMKFAGVPYLVSTDSYIKIRNAGDQMCSLVRQVCAANFDSADCKAARALWKQQ
jgi:hypothetical protein